ncbi:MAG: amidohydrolase family protein [Proteobacteria bacterium]|nr:amidohydrolase family protein [Pseudomonadota bacterium]
MVTFVVIFFLALLQCCGEKDSTSNLDLVGGGHEKRPSQSPRGEKSDKKHRLLDHTLVIDLIEDLVFRKQRDGWTLNTPQAHVNLKKIRAGGVDIIVSALPMPTDEHPWAALERALNINAELVSGTGGAVEVVSSFKAARATLDRGVIPMLLLLEGADALSGRLDRIAELDQRGLAIVGIVAGRSNVFADAAVTPRDPGGLTAKGHELLEVCRDHGLIVDVTHASPKAFWDVLIAQSGTIVVSHTAVRALRDHIRNLDDLQILALARYGGVMGLVFNPDFLEPEASAPTTLSDVVAHIMHVKAIGAIDALALGTDYGGVRPPMGLEDISRLPALTAALTRQGLSDDEIAAVVGGNAAKLFEEVERDRGAIRLTQDEIFRPAAVECDVVIEEFEGSPSLACNGYLLDRGPTLPPTSRQRIRIRDMTLNPIRLELFGEPGTPWQVEGQNLEGRVLFTRIVALDNQGKGVLSLPSGRNLTRLFCSPTRLSFLREAVVWGN